LISAAYNQTYNNNPAVEARLAQSQNVRKAEPCSTQG
jgi:hypothetical protein